MPCLFKRVHMPRVAQGPHSHAGRIPRGRKIFLKPPFVCTQQQQRRGSGNNGDERIGEG